MRFLNIKKSTGAKDNDNRNDDGDDYDVCLAPYQIVFPFKVLTALGINAIAANSH